MTHLIQPRPILPSPDDVRAFETDSDSDLPDDHRAFLLSRDGDAFGEKRADGLPVTPADCHRPADGFGELLRGPAWRRPPSTDAAP